ncbi:MAG: outer membrane lipoprotein-sorting protein [Deltaproteobacteria bacterium]|nr:outer membrane lipoprotein-sorting protein [Deltaproteobacteria bacterium]
MRSSIIAAGFTLTLLLGRAGAEPPDRVAALLRAVEAAVQPATALRADGELTVASPEQTLSYPLILLSRPGRHASELYFELGHNGGKALVLEGGARSLRLAAGASRPEPFPADAAWAGSEFSREDLQPFRAAAFGDVRISDESATRITLALVPKASQYCLLVMTIDLERKVPLKILYYRGTLNNLVKMQRDGDHARIAGSWRPRTVTMEDFKLRTQSTLRLRWTENPDFSPAVFEPAALAQSSGLRWP